MNVTKKITDTFTWTASTDQEVSLPTEGLITRIDFELALTMAGAVSGAMATHGLYRTIEAFKVQGGGGINYFSMNGKQMGMLLHFVNLIDFPCHLWHDVIATSQNVGWRLHFGSRPRDAYGRDNPFDLSAAIPAMNETNLKVIWSPCAAADTVDDGVDVSSATLYMTIHEVLGGEGAWSRMVPMSTSETYNPGATKSDLGGQVDVPTGGYVRRIALMAQDDTSLTGNGRLLVENQVTELGLILVKGNRRLISARTKTLEMQNPKFDGLTAADAPDTWAPWSQPGIYCLDLRPYDNGDYGLDTTKMRSGDVKVGMTIGAYASTEREYLWYDQVKPYGGY